MPSHAPPLTTMSSPSFVCLSVLMCPCPKPNLSNVTLQESCVLSRLSTAMKRSCLGANSRSLLPCGRASKLLLKVRASQGALPGLLRPGIVTEYSCVSAASCGVLAIALGKSFGIHQVRSAISPVLVSRLRKRMGPNSRRLRLFSGALWPLETQSFLRLAPPSRINLVRNIVHFRVSSHMMAWTPVQQLQSETLSLNNRVHQKHAERRHFSVMSKAAPSLMPCCIVICAHCSQRSLALLSLLFIRGIRFASGLPVRCMLLMRLMQSYSSYAGGPRRIRSEFIAKWAYQRIYSGSTERSL
mmetsp:Transcript_64840/g.128186  ORF Transcript_64840/g.128186 Transcript_64840/m.128186 type:complete len:299 (-) Transcript_64840:895-1791(-)